MIGLMRNVRNLLLFYLVKNCFYCWSIIMFGIKGVWCSLIGISKGFLYSLCKSVLVCIGNNDEFRVVGICVYVESFISSWYYCFF